MKRAARAVLTTSFVLLSLGAYAQGSDPAHLSLVAGYKAAFTCSAHFNAGRTVEQIAGDELHRIYSGYRETMANLPDAVIDEDSKRVSVAHGEDFPPRIAQWRPFLGCVQLPTGAKAGKFRDTTIVQHMRTIQFRDIAGPPPYVRPFDRDVISWTVLTPDSYPAIQPIVDAAFDRMTYGDGTETTAVIVMKDGAIISEKYRDGFNRDTPQRTWSVAKSIAATIIGAAVEDGIIAVDDPVGLDAWSAPGDPRGAITIENLLQMSSGLTSPTAGNRTDDIYFGGGRVVDHAIINRLVAEPGTRWRYANNETMIAMRALRERMGDDQEFLEYPFKAVLYPLGMDRTFLETDWNGDFILSSQVWTTARDLARLGLLYLSDGVLNGKRILPKGWAAYVATPAPDQPSPRANGDPRPGYGAHFWLYDESWGLPDGTYAAQGNRGQYLMIIPARNVLVVRRGFDDGGGFDIAKFSSDVLAALPE